jgi:hypothetical protein
LTDSTDELVGLDGVLVQEGPGEDDDCSQLEIDDFQTQEIRQIFLTTLPDYLEPVRQMTAQLFSGTDGQEEVRKALDTTLGSIAVAASRVEINDVCATVERLRAELGRFGQVDEAQTREAVARGLREIEQLAAAAGVRPEAARVGAPVQTIVQAFDRIQHIDRSVLRRLTAAGLVSVQQIRMARPDEIVAVTGLSPAVVDALVAALGSDADSRAPSTCAEPSVPSAADPLQAELAQSLRVQVDTEVQLDELRGEILQRRLSVAALSEEASTAEQRCGELRQQLLRSRKEGADRLATLASARAQRAKLERRQAEQKDAVVRAEQKLIELERERASEEQAQGLTAESLGTLVSRLRRMVEQASAAGAGYSGLAEPHGGLQWSSHGRKGPA